MENQEKLVLSIQKEMIQFNLKRMRVVAWTLMYISTIITIIHYGEVFFSNSERAMVPAYIAIHTILFYIDLTVLLFVKEKKFQVTTLNMRKYESILLAYIYTILLLITVITVMDVYFFKHAALYEVLFLMICTVFSVPFRKIFGIIVITVPPILISAYMSVGVSGEGIKILLPMSLIIPIGLVIQRHTYKMQRQFTKKHILLQEEMTKSKKLSKLLAEKNNELSEQALRDTLTNLPNRRALNNKLTQIGQQLSKPKSLSVMMIDIDFFKNFNDYYGHLQGDEALIKVAALLDEIAEKYNAFAARWGGEEFVIVSQHAAKFSEHVCEEILEEVRNLNIRHEHSLVADIVTVSIGMCHVKITNSEQLKTCCELADQALYTAKQHGRNIFYSKSGNFDEDVCLPL
ncbi:response regulator receiver protein [Lysinibacillus sphaericus]|uniref:GGDEF domain-containing protein n=1 Tax=Lysinibacillus sphaericus TaxID=1421 RepID=UPI0018CCE2AC|nr:GGDEF domain-containing protein [Lysinibacillus sphaericus]MBG9455137.1 response regulator receiver protein [Lysinibacillus sphaericus]MBG9478681.1 response regulator receiver protein [Lysinibacillus sphaericus]MBG9592408.1 response regulator receiver protein [Lysinibacillus sphaericus]